MRSALSSKMVNEIRGGWQSSPNNFFGNITASMFENQGGYYLNFPTITDVGDDNSMQPRNTPNWSLEDTLSRQWGSHSLSMGGSWQRTEHRQNGANAVPELAFGVDTNFDPANAMFNTTNFQGASTNNLTEARNIYAILTGRITGVNGTARLDANTGKYVYLGNLYQASRMDSADLYAQDSWRITPALTLNYGLRWDVQLPFTPVTNTWSTTSLADLCGISGIGSGPGGRAATCSSRQHSGADFQAVLSAVRAGRQAGADRLEQPQPERGRRLAAERPGWLAAHAARRSGAGHSARRLLGDVRLRAHGPVHGPLRRQPGWHDRRVA